MFLKTAEVAKVLTVHIIQALNDKRSNDPCPLDRYSSSTHNALTAATTRRTPSGQSNRRGLALPTEAHPEASL